MRCIRCISILLSAALLFTLSGCSQEPDLSGETSLSGADSMDETGVSIRVPEPAEDRLPLVEDGAIRMYYDDRLSIAEIAENAAAVELSGESVVVHDTQNNQLIAVGVGKTDIAVDGATYTLTVESAPISLVMITGHSIGAGQTGIKAKSVLCQDGQAYSTHGVKHANGETEGIGIGYDADVKPDGIDAFTAAGEGTIGEGSGLAYRWNQITGEKIWVLNAAVGGSSLDQWTMGTKNYENAVALFRFAQKILSSEIALGHYRLKDMAIIYHSAANYEYNNVVYYDEMAQKWYHSMWNGFKEDLSMDMTGDGEKETVNALGLVPIYTTGKMDIRHDKLANYCMGAMDVYPDIFMASMATRYWLADVNSFPLIDYETHGEPVYMPQRKEHILSDGVHLHQEAYNAAGMDIAENLFAHLRTPVLLESLTLQNDDGNKVYDEVTLKRVGASISLFPIVEPMAVSDLTFIVSDNLEIVYPCVITAVAPGTGTLTISQGNKVIRTITIEVKE